MLNINDVIKVSKNIQDDIRAGHLGTVVHIFDQNPPVYLIEFIDIVGCSKEPEPVDTNTKEMSIQTVNVDTVALRPMTGR